LAAVAARQHGLVTTAQIAEIGLGRPAISNRVADGRLHPLYRGVYAVGHAKLSQEAKWMAAVLAAGDGAALSHLAAAKHWNIWRRQAPHIDVITPGQRRSRAGVTIHRCRALDPRDVTRHRGIPITTVPRTLVDLATTLTAAQLANVIHEAAFRNRFSAERTQETIKRAAGRDLSNLHTALQAHASGSAGTRSDLEDQFLAETGGTPPMVNTKIEVDFYWPDENLVVEIDGPGHERPRTKAEDAARDRALEAAGLTVVRIPSGHG
jgi:predicted transcriptional regulator of viral defense system